METYPLSYETERFSGSITWERSRPGGYAGETPALPAKKADRFSAAPMSKNCDIMDCMSMIL
jgi:hypothetical protein